MRSIYMALLLTSASLFPLTAQSQQNSTLQVGARVRVFFPNHKRAKGSVTRIDADSIILSDRKSEWLVARSDVARIQVAKRNRPLGALKYGIIGTATGVVTGAAILGLSYHDEPSCLILCGASYAAAAGGAAGGIVGLGVGLVAGAIRGQEVWTDVPRR